MLQNIVFYITGSFSSSIVTVT